MKDLCQYGNRPEDEWEILPWIPDPRPPFKIWVKLEQIAPFFLIPHHPYAISLLLKISDGFRAEEFCRLGLTGSSGDWERLVRGVIREFEENNSGVDLFHFDSDEDVFCVYSYNKIVVFIDRSPAECYNSFRVLWIGEALLPQRRFLGGSNHSFFVEMLIS